MRVIYNFLGTIEMKGINWIEEAQAYSEFLDDSPLEKDITEEEAKRYIKEEIENVIAINGRNELYESEEKLYKLLELLK